jgi:hypothetical protein
LPGTTLFGAVPAVAVLYTSKPIAGEVTGVAAFMAVSATRGGRNPLLVNLTSNPAEGSGWLPSVLKAPCENAMLQLSSSIQIKKVSFFILSYLFKRLALYLSLFERYIHTFFFCLYQT